MDRDILYCILMECNIQTIKNLCYIDKNNYYLCDEVTFKHFWVNKFSKDKVILMKDEIPKNWSRWITNYRYNWMFGRIKGAKKITNELTELKIYYDDRKTAVNILKLSILNHYGRKYNNIYIDMYQNNRFKFIYLVFLDMMTQPPQFDIYHTTRLKFSKNKYYIILMGSERQLLINEEQIDIDNEDIIDRDIWIETDYVQFEILFTLLLYNNTEYKDIRDVWGTSFLSHNLDNNIPDQQRRLRHWDLIYNNKI